MSSISWASLYLISEWIIRIGMLVAVPFRRSPEAAKGWLLFGFFLPWPALALYLAIGRPAYPRWRRERFARLPAVLARTAAPVLEAQAAGTPVLPANLAQAATLIRNLGHFPSLGGNSVELLSDYDGTLRRLAADIDGARSHVHLLFYIFADDGSGRTIIEALARAVRRGVACRVLIDALGSRAWAPRTVAALEAAGVAVRLVLPVGLMRRHSTRADLRNHRKIAVIDGRIGFVGSQNVVDADFNPRVVNRELVARVTGPVVIELQAVFVADWFLETEEVLEDPTLFPAPAPDESSRASAAGEVPDDPALFPAPPPAGGAVAQVLPSGPDYPGAGIERLLDALVHGARERVVLTTPYFVPDDALLRAMETATLRGVEVHLVLSKPVDQILVNLAQRSYYAELLEAGVAIHLYRDRLLHAKHASIDREIALIGSSNIDMRSFTLNAEISLVLFDSDATARLHAVEEEYFANSERLSAEAWRARPLRARIVENVARLLSPLL
ncbi:MAG TPA: phospholipase D-like domain-containing protein [Microvirga sp.]|jgi:cardiolipin synthase|nr:phospholipase D-like domain-containing protein [Microvirga sp.]